MVASRSVVVLFCVDTVIVGVLQWLQSPFVTLQTQKGPKHEKDILKVPVDFSFLTIQSN